MSYEQSHCDAVQNSAVLEDDCVSLDNRIRCFEGTVIFRNVGNQLSSDARHIPQELSPQVIVQQQSAQSAPSDNFCDVSKFLLTGVLAIRNKNKRTDCFRKECTLPWRWAYKSLSFSRMDLPTATSLSRPFSPRPLSPQHKLQIAKLKRRKTSFCLFRWKSEAWYDPWRADPTHSRIVSAVTLRACFLDCFFLSLCTTFVIAFSTTKENMPALFSVEKNSKSLYVCCY